LILSDSDIEDQRAIEFFKNLERQKLKVFFYVATKLVIMAS